MNITKNCCRNTWYYRLIDRYTNIRPTCDDACYGAETCQLPKIKALKGCQKPCQQGRKCDCDGSHHAQ
jgi:hypothetical protein